MWKKHAEYAFEQVRWYLSRPVCIRILSFPTKPNTFNTLTMLTLVTARLSTPPSFALWEFFATFQTRRFFLPSFGG